MTPKTTAPAPMTDSMAQTLKDVLTHNLTSARTMLYKYQNADELERFQRNPLVARLSEFNAGTIKALEKRGYVRSGTAPCVRGTSVIITESGLNWLQSADYLFVRQWVEDRKAFLVLGTYDAKILKAIGAANNTVAPLRALSFKREKFAGYDGYLNGYEKLHGHICVNWWTDTGHISAEFSSSWQLHLNGGVRDTQILADLVDLSAYVGVLNAELSKIPYPVTVEAWDWVEVLNLVRSSQHA